MLFARWQHHIRFGSGFPYAPLKAMLTKISKWSRIQDSFRITPKIKSLVVFAIPDIPRKFQKDPSITFWVILLTQTDRQTDRQTNKQTKSGKKHNLLGGSKYRGYWCKNVVKVKRRLLKWFTCLIAWCWQLQAWHTRMDCMCMNAAIVVLFDWLTPTQSTTEKYVDRSPVPGVCRHQQYWARQRLLPAAQRPCVRPTTYGGVLWRRDCTETVRRGRWPWNQPSVTATMHQSTRHRAARSAEIGDNEGLVKKSHFFFAFCLSDIADSLFYDVFFTFVKFSVNKKTSEIEINIIVELRGTKEPRNPLTTYVAFLEVKWVNWILRVVSGILSDMLIALLEAMNLENLDQQSLNYAPIRQRTIQSCMM